MKKFFIEFITRLRHPAPAFFKIIGFVGGVSAIISILPEILSLFNIHVANGGMFAKIIATAGTTSFLISKLTVIKEDVPNERKNLPFTYKNDKS